MNSKNKHDFLVQGVILAMASIIVRIIGILYRIPLQNILGDEGIGYYSTAYTIYSIMLILSSYSLPTAISKLVSTRIAKKEYINAYKVFVGGLLIATTFGSIAAIITYFFADNLAIAFNFPESALALKSLAPTLVLVAIMGVFRGFYQGFSTMLPTAISQIIEKIIQVILSLVLCYNFLDAATDKGQAIPESYGAFGATLGNAFGALAGLLFLIFVFFAFKPVLSKKMRKNKDSFEEDYKTIFKLLGLTIVPVLLSTTVNNISNLIDNYMFGNIMKFHGLSKSSIASLWGILNSKYNTLITLPVSVASAIAVATMPSMSVSVAVDSKENSLKKIGISIRTIYLFAAPCAMGIMILANPLLQLLYYDKTTGNATGTYLLWLGAVTIILSSLVAITNSVLQGMGHLKTPVIHCAIGILVHVVVALMLLLMKLSVYSIVIAEIALSVTTLTLNYMFIVKNYNYRQEIKKTFLIPTACTLIMGVFTSLSYHGIHLICRNRLILVLIPMIFAVISYVLSLVFLKGLTKDDLKQFPKGHLILKFFEKIKLM